MGCDSRFVTGFGTFKTERILMVMQRSSSFVARSALACGSLVAAVLVTVSSAPVQAHHETTAPGLTQQAESVMAPAADSSSFKANTGKKVAAESKAARAERKKAERAARKEAHASKSAKKSSRDSDSDKRPKVAKVEKSKASNDDAMNGGSDDPLEGL